jgi:hypothetical protein
MNHPTQTNKTLSNIGVAIQLPIAPRDPVSYGPSVRYSGTWSFGSFVH